MLDRVGLGLCHCMRRWPNIKPTQVQRLAACGDQDSRASAIITGT